MYASLAISSQNHHTARAACSQRKWLMTFTTQRFPATKRATFLRLTPIPKKGTNPAKQSLGRQTQRTNGGFARRRGGGQSLLVLRSDQQSCDPQVIWILKHNARHADHPQTNSGVLPITRYIPLNRLTECTEGQLAKR